MTNTTEPPEEEKWTYEGFARFSSPSMDGRREAHFSTKHNQSDSRAKKSILISPAALDAKLKDAFEAGRRPYEILCKEMSFHWKVEPKDFGKVEPKDFEDYKKQKEGGK